jgi:hypothetical protein
LAEAGAIDVDRKHFDAFTEKPEDDGPADAAAGASHDSATPFRWRAHR